MSLLLSSALVCALCLGIGILLLIAGKLFSGGMMMFWAGVMAMMFIMQCLEKQK